MDRAAQPSGRSLVLGQSKDFKRIADSLQGTNSCLENSDSACSRTRHIPGRKQNKFLTSHLLQKPFKHSVVVLNKLLLGELLNMFSQEALMVVIELRLS